MLTTESNPLSSHGGQFLEDDVDDDPTTPHAPTAEAAEPPGPAAEPEGQQLLPLAATRHTWQGVGYCALGLALTVGSLLLAASSVQLDTDDDASGYSPLELALDVLARPADYLLIPMPDRVEQLPRPATQRALRLGVAAAMIGAALQLARRAGQRLGARRERCCAPCHRPVLCGRVRRRRLLELLLLLGGWAWLLLPPRSRRCGLSSHHDELSEGCGFWEARLPPPVGVASLRPIARRLGSVSVQLLAMAMLPLPKRSWLLALTGVPYERAIAWHRQLGRFVVLTAAAHVGLTIVDWQQQAMPGQGMAALLREHLSPFCAEVQAPSSYPYHAANNPANASTRDLPRSGRGLQQSTPSGTVLLPALGSVVRNKLCSAPSTQRLFCSTYIQRLSDR
jgi:hypothetical protein